MSHEKHDLELESLAVPAGWMIAPRSFAVDRIVPDMERIWLPPTSTGGGKISVAEGTFTYPPPMTRRPRFLQSKNSPAVDFKSKLLIDLREGAPGNWAHFLNIHLALLALASRATGQPWKRFAILLPEKTPNYIRRLADLLGLETVCTNASVTGKGVWINFDDWNVIRGVRHTLLQDPEISPVASAISTGVIARPAQPEKLFLARKGTRALKNQPEIETLLASRGFEVAFPETWPVAEQLSRIAFASEIVAVHGAALAPIIYRTPDTPALRLVEVFPVGHVTNVYRAVLAGLGGKWCSVRGHHASENLPDIYKLGSPYLKHSLSNFTVDSDTLVAALEHGLDGFEVKNWACHQLR